MAGKTVLSLQPEPPGTATAWCSESGEHHGGMTSGGCPVAVASAMNKLLKTNS
jgi:hypothetical protein